MIHTYDLMLSLDEILGSNMFLKDAQKVDNLKGSISCIFGNIDTNMISIRTELDSTTNQTFTNLE